MQVEITEKALKDAGHDLRKGDRITVDDDLGKYWCKHGWAKDTSGKVKSGPRVPGVASLEVQPGKIGARSRTDG